VKTWSTPVCEEKSAAVPCCCCGSLSFKTALNCEGFTFVRCKTCGLVQRNPQPLKEEITARYSRTFGKDYLSYEIENENNFLKLQKLALLDAGFYKLEKSLCAANETQPYLLDIGCATGALLASLRDSGWRVTGVEISPSAEYGRNIRKLDIRNLALEENKFPNDSFDVVLASHLIEHLNDPFSFLNEVRRILKESGHVFITTPNISGFQARLFGGRWRSAIFDHLYLFSVNTLKKMLKNAGFCVEVFSTWGGLGAGFAPAWIKKIADFFAKRFNCGDVMIIRARKKNLSTVPM
jgi:2-polyprenyl-3-methyl-5-hydroxy-6-metoxy-1,4-benzoquinol methylase